MKSTAIILCLTLGMLFTVNTTSEPIDPGEDKRAEASMEESQPEEVANEVVRALKKKDMYFLSKYVHPSKGVRFTPYAYVQMDKDQVFSAEQIIELLNDQSLYTWGEFDGTGEPITMSFADYYARFVYDHDYLNAQQIAVNERIGQGNSIDNSAGIYPEATVVEYHFSGFNPEYAGMDWSSLRIVLEQEGEEWYLVGIIHDEWTI